MNDDESGAITAFAAARLTSLAVGRRALRDKLITDAGPLLVPGTVRVRVWIGPREIADGAALLRQTRQAMTPGGPLDELEHALSEVVSMGGTDADPAVLMIGSADVTGNPLPPRGAPPN